jgi:methionyl-tRNA formyltransferase
MSARRLVMCGNHVGGEPVVRGLLEAGYRFAWFVCQTREQAVEAGVSGYFDYGPLALDNDIPVYHPESFALDGERDRAFFEEHRFDLLVQGGWQRLFPDAVLQTLRIGAIGVHGSSDFLPKGRGRSPLNWSLIEGRRRFIMHLFLITAGADDGDVFDTEMFDINEFDDIETLYWKYSIVLRRMHVRSLPRLLAGEIESVPQHGVPSWYPKRSPSDARIDWEEMDVWQIYDAVRAQTRPYPGAFGEIGGTTYRIWRCRPFDTRISYPDAGYGDCVERFGERMIVNCRGGLLVVEDYEELSAPPS